MISRLIDQIKSWFNPADKKSQSQWVAISICFVLAVTLWFLVTLNTQSFTSQFDIPLKVINLPDDYQLREELPPYLKVHTKGKGIDLLNEMLEASGDTVQVDFNTFQSQEYFIASNNLGIINQGLRAELNSFRVEPDSISLKYVPRSSKKIPVELDLKLDLPLGFRHFGKLKPIKDSILLVGPQKELDSVTSWKTVFKESGRITQPTQLLVQLEDSVPFSVSPKILKVNVNPVAYTERILKVPIKASNLPSNSSIRFSPDSIALDILVSLSSYESIELTNIYMEVDFSTLDQRSNLTIPQLKGFPDYAEFQSSEPNLVKYLIITEQ